MSVRTLLTVALALAFGLSAAVGVNALLSGARAGSAAPTVAVVAASVAIPRGGTITADQVKTIQFPRDLVPPGTVTKLEDALDRGVYIPLVPGEPVLDAKLAPKGAGRGLQALIPDGMRAFTIQTPGAAAQVAGFILPGNRVDVLLTMTGEDDGGGHTTTLLQDVEILAVDQRIDAPAENKVDARGLQTVTLLVTLSQASKLDLAQNKGGVLHLALRSLKDRKPVNTVPVTMAGLRFHQERPWDERAKSVFEAMGKALAQAKPAPRAAEPPKAPEPRRVQIRTIRGPQEGQVTVHLPGAAPGR